MIIIMGPYVPMLVAQAQNPDMVIYNLDCPVNYGQSIRAILPDKFPENLFPGDPAYDSYLANYIMTNPYSFNTLMTILYNAYMGTPGYILINTAWWTDVYAESLIKFIQFRYGINIYRINDVEDLQYCRETSFSVQGRQQFQADKEKFISENSEFFLRGIPDQQYEY